MTEIPPHPMNFPFSRSCPFDPPAQYRPLRAGGALTKVTLHNGRTAWLATRYEHVRALLAHPHISSDARHPNFPALGVGEREAAATLRPFIRMDPPEHTEIRRMLTGTFTLKQVATMRPAIQAIADEAVTAMLAVDPPVDLVEVYANRVSTTTICHLLGIHTADDLAFFRKVTSISGARSSTTEQVNAALGELFHLLNRVIDEKQANPGADLISRLVTGPLRDGEISREALLSQIGITLNAGHETSRNMIALGVLTLLHHPDQLDMLRADPGLLPGAVEELLRYLSVADVVPLRVALADVTLDGHTIRAGDAVIASLGSANRDPAVFTDPDSLNIQRTARHHMAFGHGSHLCIGGHLGRLELEIAIGTLLNRVPTLQATTSPEDLPSRQGTAVFGLEELPVRW